MSGAHSFIAPSSAGVWVHCHAAPLMAAMFPQLEESDDDRAGTAAHWVGSECLIAGSAPADYMRKVAPNGVVIDQDIIDSVNVYVDDVRENTAPFQPLEVEQRIHAPSVHPESYGTPDALQHKGGEVWIWDFKHGHVAVEPYENWQLINYAASVLDRYVAGGLVDQSITFVLTVVQPRAQHSEGPVRRWRVAGSDLRGYVNRLAHAAAKVFQGDQPTVSGAHCVYCPARLHCDAFTKSVGTALDYVGTAMPSIVTPQQVGTELVLLERAELLIKARKAAAVERAEQFIASGQPVAGWQLATKYGRLSWSQPVEVVAAIVPGAAVQELITPTQAFKRKLIDKQTAELMGLLETPARGRELIRDDGTRARLAFGAFKP